MTLSVTLSGEVGRLICILTPVGMMGGVDGTCSVLSVGVAAITLCCVSVGGEIGCSNGKLCSRWLDELLIC